MGTAEKYFAQGAINKNVLFFGTRILPLKRDNTEILV
jgi:hypothetical protein